VFDITARRTKILGNSNKQFSCATDPIRMVSILVMIPFLSGYVHKF